MFATLLRISRVKLFSLSVLGVVTLCSCRSAPEATSVSPEELQGAPNGSRKLKVVYNSGLPRPADSSAQVQAPSRARMPAEPPAAAQPAAVGSGSIADAVASPRDVVWDAPANWQSETPSSTMRVAQYRVGHVSSDTEDAEITVFYFGPSGAGGVDENLNRWVKMFDEASQANAKRSQGKAGDQAMHIVDTFGTYQSSMAMPTPGAAQNPQPKTGMALVGAVVETGLGPYYFKLLGQQKTVESSRVAFLKMAATTRLATAKAAAGVSDAGATKPADAAAVKPASK